MMVRSSTVDRQGREYVMEYDDVDPARPLRLITGEGAVSIPAEILDRLLRKWELDVIHDYLERRPVRSDLAGPSPE